MISGTKIHWTNHSVRRLAQNGDPIDAILSRARKVVLRAQDEGWTGPPFDPFALAGTLGLELLPNADLRDARTVPCSGGRYRIEYNPTRSRARVNYSIAHEIAHTLFDDCGSAIRHRAAKQEMRSDEWQLEMLCNLAAAELLMPIGSFDYIAQNGVSVHALGELRRKFETSSEAILLRWIHLTDETAFIFSASTTDSDLRRCKYKIDYVRGNVDRAFEALFRREIPSNSVVRNCTAIGYSDEGVETWAPELGKMKVECIGLPPYPGSLLPRVVGICRPIGAKSKEKNPIIVNGDATQPRGDGPRIIAHIVNNRAVNWGAGFGKKISQKYPTAAAAFKRAIATKELKLRLGNVFRTEVSPDLTIFQLIAQRGYGEKGVSRISYDGLSDGLQKLALYAKDKQASVHMPKIGTGYGGGNWGIISEMIRYELCDRGVPVKIYSLPGESSATSPQDLLL